MTPTKQAQLKKFRARPFSWSQFSSFRDYDKEEWYNNYILGVKAPPNARMTFGSLVGKRIEKDLSYIPQLKRGGVMEYEVKVKMGDIELVGYMDQYFTETKEIHEYKTGGASSWNQKKVDSHQQLDFYSLLLYLRDKVKPEEISFNLFHLHTEEKGDFSIGFVKPFKLDHYTTKRTTKQIKLFGAEIIRIRKEMINYILEHK